MRRKSVLERSPALDASRGAYDLSTSIGRCSLINMPTDLFRLLKTFDESRRFLRSFRRTERVRRICFVPAADRFSKRALSLSLSLSYSLRCGAMKYAIERGNAAGDDGKRWFIRLTDELQSVSRCAFASFCMVMIFKLKIRDAIDEDLGNTVCFRHGEAA